MGDQGSENIFLRRFKELQLLIKTKLSVLKCEVLKKNKKLTFIFFFSSFRLIFESGT